MSYLNETEKKEEIVRKVQEVQNLLRRTSANKKNNLNRAEMLLYEIEVDLTDYWVTELKQNNNKEETE